jgi:hypothetical protein
MGSTEHRQLWSCLDDFEADAACVAELFSGGRLWKTFTEHVSEFDARRERVWSVWSWWL